MATLTKIERPAEAASAVDVAEPAAPVVKEFKGLSGQTVVIKAQDLAGADVIVLSENTDCEFELAGVAATKVVCQESSGVLIKIPLGCSLSSGTVEIRACKGLRIKTTMPLRLVEAWDSSTVSVTFNNPEQLGEIKHQGVTDLSVAFANAAEYNTAVTPDTLAKAAPDAPADTTLFVTRFFDAEVITEDSLKRDEEDRIKKEKAKPKMDPEQKAMLARAKEMLGDKKPEGIDHTVSGHSGETLTVAKADLPDKPVLMLQDNTDCTIEVKDASLVKLLVQGCSGCVVILPASCTIITSTIEVWDCKGITLNSAIEIGTIQVDMCEDVKIQFPTGKALGQVVQAGVHSLAITFEQEPQLNTSLTLPVLQTIAPGLLPEDNTTQIITRLIDGKVLSEEIIRLANDFPTTEREKAKHDKDIEAKDAALREMANSMLSNVGDKLSPAEKQTIQGEVLKQTAGHAASVDTDTGVDARVEFKKKQGNEAFKAKDYQQAAVFYTDCITLKENVPVIWANRSMCWLKMSEAAKALADADKSISLDANYTKAHFRRGVALIELKRFVDALKTFRTVLDLDPKNAAAKASMMLAEKKLSMQNR